MDKDDQLAKPRAKQKNQTLLVVAGLFLISIALLRQTVFATSIKPKDFINPQPNILIDNLLPVRLSSGEMLDVAVSQGKIIDSKWEVLTDKATYLETSARPRSNGNIIIYGHNTREVLNNLRAIVPGQYVTLKLSGGSFRRYQVTHTIEVSPSDTSWLEPTDTEILTVYTCSGLLDSKRFILRATPVGEIL